MNRRESAALDAHITREQPEEAMWCTICSCDSEQCEMPERVEIVDDVVAGGEVTYWTKAHTSAWITRAEREQALAEDAAYERGHDKEETGD